VKNSFFALALLVSILHAGDIAESTITAIKNGDIAFMKQSKEIKALADSSTANGKTAFMLAVWEGKNEIVELFIKSGASVNQADMEGKSPLMLAVWRENLPLVKLLIQNGADIDAKNKDGIGAKDMAELSGNGEIIDFLEGVK
jgi:ankyrin repeat protein